MPGSIPLLLYPCGDIVVSAPPAPGGDDPSLKRVIGLAGDEVEIDGDPVMVNGAKLDEGAIASANRYGTSRRSCGNGAGWSS